MGIGDSIKKGAEYAMEDLAGTAKKSDDGHAPDPGNPRDEVQVHSSISEGSNAMEGERDDNDGALTGDRAATDPTSTPPGERPADPTQPPGGPLDNPVNDPDNAPPLGDPAPGPDSAPGSVPGPGGLPETQPGQFRGDPSEGDGDPTLSMGRG
ncbi:hypothetical protein [uncultured Arthrobacter sp.]|uniref:hypothetical protein n=1 Tax=uncultured Arthrobacter sp. TaxID=114050 RepID=UPI0032178845